jgi:hypothetical protein
MKNLSEIGKLAQVFVMMSEMLPFQILDSELFEHMHHHGDYTHFYFCYRWFLLDFKRGEKSFFCNMYYWIFYKQCIGF